MLKNILKIFADDNVSQLEPDDARLAITALMIRVARSDDDYSKAELNNIIGLISTRFKLNNDEANKLIKEAELVEEQAPDTVRFTKSIKSAIDFDDRIAIIEDLWSVVLTDSFRDTNEDALIRTVVSLLGVSDKDSAFARQRAIKK
ncbi:MAG: TerB family tellurite resistance protein [Rhodobacteraceae bacterium]|nr:TerB family tellurite resistance protein [Paracoccaceae bacterium]